MHLYQGRVGTAAAPNATMAQVDPRAREHPEIGFGFGDDGAVEGGAPADLQHAAVDTRVPVRSTVH